MAFANPFPGDASPTLVAAQVVSGIGFQGAGIIFREGLNVRGLNTAATLWCSAAVGLLAGSGAHAEAVLAAAMILGILLLRPLPRFIQSDAAVEVETPYEIGVISRAESEAAVRTLLLQGLSAGGLHLRDLDSSDIEGTDRVWAIMICKQPASPSKCKTSADPGIWSTEQ